MKTDYNRKILHNFKTNNYIYYQNKLLILDDIDKIDSITYKKSKAIIILVDGKILNVEYVSKLSMCGCLIDIHNSDKIKLSEIS